MTTTDEEGTGRPPSLIQRLTEAATTIEQIPVTSPAGLAGAGRAEQDQAAADADRVPVEQGQPPSGGDDLCKVLLVAAMVMWVW